MMQSQILSNFVPNEIIIYDHRDPPWMNRHIKKSYSLQR